MVPNLHLLEDAVQYAYEKACSEQDYEIAEFLLRALETLSQRDESHTHINDFYLKFHSSQIKNH